MSDKLIYAFTEIGAGLAYPGFVNLSEREDGATVLQVRGTGGREHAHLALDDDRLEGLALAIGTYLTAKRARKADNDFPLPSTQVCALGRPGGCESCQ